jgi:hypothetical protein
MLDEKFGKIDDYSDYNRERVEIRNPAVYTYTQNEITKKESCYNNFHDIYPPVQIKKDEANAEKFYYNFYLKQKALKGLERTADVKDTAEFDINQLDKFLDDDYDENI